MRRFSKPWAALAGLILGLSLQIVPTAAAGQAAAPAARPADVASPEAILNAVYDVISGPAGKARDWDRWRSLFWPGAHLIAVSRPGANGTAPLRARVLTPDDYVNLSGPVLEKHGFAEHSINNHMDRFGDIAEVFSTYESRHDPKDAQPFERGINSFQLFFDGTRWWVVTIYWQGETAANPIPAQFLAGKNR